MHHKNALHSVTSSLKSDRQKQLSASLCFLQFTLVMGALASNAGRDSCLLEAFAVSARFSVAILTTRAPVQTRTAM